MKKPQSSASRAKSPSKKASRYARGWETRRRNAKLKELNVHHDSLRAETKSTALNPAAPPADDRPLDRNEQLLANLMSLRKKDGKDVALRMLRDHVNEERAQAAEIADRGTRALFQNAARKAEDRIVCGFIAEVAVTMKQNGGRLPDGLVFNVAAVTAEKVVKALGLAGYKADGFFGERERIGEMAIERNAEKRERASYNNSF